MNRLFIYAYLRLEPQKNHMNKAQKDAFASLRTEWWRWAESNRRAKDFLKCFYIVYSALIFNSGLRQKFRYLDLKADKISRRLLPTPPKRDSNICRQIQIFYLKNITLCSAYRESAGRTALGLVLSQSERESKRR